MWAHCGMVSGAVGRTAVRCAQCLSLIGGEPCFIPCHGPLSWSDHAAVPAHPHCQTTLWLLTGPPLNCLSAGGGDRDAEQPGAGSCRAAVGDGGHRGHRRCDAADARERHHHPGADVPPQAKWPGSMRIASGTCFSPKSFDSLASCTLLCREAPTATHLACTKEWQVQLRSRRGLRWSCTESGINCT